MIKRLDDDLEIEKIKRNAFEQYGKRGMLEVTGIPHEDGENCIDIIYKICELTPTNIKKSKIEISHRMKNGAIIVKFKDRPARDLLYSNKLKLKEKSIKDLGYRNETSIYINESLSFDTKKCLFDVRNKSRTLGYNTVITDNRLIKLKTINENGDYKWVKIANRNDLYRLK